MRRTYKITAVLIVLAMALSVAFTGCSDAGPSMKITVDGHEFQLDCKVSEILNAGFKLSEIDHTSGLIKEFPEIEARSLLTSCVYLITPGGQLTHVGIKVYNKSVNPLKYEDCNVYSFEYECGEYGSSRNVAAIPVRFNGLDFNFTDRAKTVGDLESQGFHFKDADKADFLKSGDAYSTSLLGATNTGSNRMYVKNSYDYETGERYINGFEFCIHLSYDTSNAWSEPK